MPCIFSCPCSATIFFLLSCKMNPECNVIEHVVMKKLKEGVREEEKAELLDVIWSLQYHIDTILSLSAGKLIEEKEGCTHAYHVQFSTKEALDAFESHPAFLAVEAYCKGSLPTVFLFNLEGKVDADKELLWLNQKNFEHGLDHIFCTELTEGATDVQLSEIMDALFRMTSEIGPSSILHCIPGFIFKSYNCRNKVGLVARLP